MRKLGVTFSPLNDERKDRIERVAKDFEIIYTHDQDERLKDCEVVFGAMDPKLVSESNTLKWLHVQWAGVEHVLKSAYGFPADVILTNSSGSYGVTISEYLLTVGLMLMRHMEKYVLQQQQRVWQRLEKEKSIYGSTICILGLGDIGREYAMRVKAMGAAKVVGVVRTIKEKPSFVDELYTTADVEKAVKGADVVAICLPGTKETFGLVDEALIQKMKKGVIILNIGRGKVIDTPALIAALQSGQVGAAGLDVTDPEPLPADSPLWLMSNVMITPHVSGNNTLETTNDLGVEKFVQYMDDYVNGRKFNRVVDQELGY